MADRYAIDAVRGDRADGGPERGQDRPRRAQQGRGEAGIADLWPRSESLCRPAAELKVAWDRAVPEPFRLREEAVLRADLAQLSGRAQSARQADGGKSWRRKKRLNMSIAFQNTLMNTLNQRVSTRQEAIDLKVGTKIDLYNAKEELEKSEAALASDQGQLIETRRGDQVGAQRKGQDRLPSSSPTTRTSFADAARKADEAGVRRWPSADARLARTRLYAPTDGARSPRRWPSPRSAAGRHHRPAAHRADADRRQASGSRRWWPISISASSSPARVMR